MVSKGDEPNYPDHDEKGKQCNAAIRWNFIEQIIAQCPWCAISREAFGRSDSTRPRGTPLGRTP